MRKKINEIYGRYSPYQINLDIVCPKKEKVENETQTFTNCRK